MSGISSNRNKKIPKKNKLLNGSKVVQVKSAKLEPKNATATSTKGIIAKSEDCLKTCLKDKITEVHQQTYSNPGDELDSGIITQIKQMSIRNDGENVTVPSTSYCRKDSHSDSELNKSIDGSLGPIMVDTNENYEYACAYTNNKYPTKHTKSIKFTNQVTVLHFNGDDIISESMEPLKKELEQQLRNKEMRKEHLITKGHQIDNVYLF